MATNYDLNITKGSQFDIALRAKDSAGNGIDLTNYTTSGFVGGGTTNKLPGTFFAGKIDDD